MDTVYENEHFRVEPCHSCFIPGYMLVVPRVPVESIAEMKSDALTSLGLTLARVTWALETALRPQRVYCALFAEQVRTVHFHLLPRTKWLLAEYIKQFHRTDPISGPLLFEWGRQTFTHPLEGFSRDETALRIQRLLTHQLRS